jgi:hypothetical protein
MISEKDVTSQRFLNLSDEDEDNPISKLKYQVGDKLIFTGDPNINNNFNILDNFSEYPVIEIKDIKVNEEGSLCYEAYIIHPNRGAFKVWTVEDEFLDSHWKMVENFRLISLDDE